MQLLIATGSQRLCSRREPVVPSHYREIEAITNLLPHHRLLWTLGEGEVPALIELPNRISREHSKGQRRRRVRFTQSFDKLKHRTCLLHRLPAENVTPSISPAWCRARTRRTMSLPSVGAPSNGWLARFQHSGQ